MTTRRAARHRESSRRAAARRAELALQKVLASGRPTAVQVTKVVAATAFFVPLTPVAASAAGHQGAPVSAHVATPVDDVSDPVPSPGPTHIEQPPTPPPPTPPGDGGPSGPDSGDPELPDFCGLRLLSIGDQGKDVAWVQQQVNTQVDGDFGRRTRRAVETYQAQHGLRADGLIGPRTWAALGCSSSI